MISADLNTTKITFLMALFLCWILFDGSPSLSDQEQGDDFQKQYREYQGYVRSGNAAINNVSGNTSLSIQFVSQPWLLKWIPMTIPYGENIKPGLWTTHQCPLKCFQVIEIPVFQRLVISHRMGMTNNHARWLFLNQICERRYDSRIFTYYVITMKKSTIMDSYLHKYQL